MKKVMVFGTFDVFHYGHLTFLKQSKEMGAYLIVVIARDVNVLKIKGSLPFHNEKERLEIINSIKIVDEAILGDQKDVYKVILEKKPDIIALGYDQMTYTDNLTKILKQNNLETKVARLEPFQENRLKSKIIKKIGSN